MPSGVDDVFLLSMKLDWAEDKSGSTTQVDIWHPRVTWSTKEIGLASNVLHNGPQGPLGGGGGKCAKAWLHLGDCGVNMRARDVVNLWISTGVDCFVVCTCA